MSERRKWRRVVIVEVAGVVLTFAGAFALLELLKVIAVATYAA